jgi:hypothetical protein
VVVRAHADVEWDRVVAEAEEACAAHGRTAVSVSASCVRLRGRSCGSFFGLLSHGEWDYLFDCV